MNIRCNYCRQSFNLGQEYVTQLVREADEAKQKNAVVDCIHCRKRIKVSVKLMRRFAAPIEESAPVEEAASVEEAAPVEETAV
jgi:DNA-directed RNA polymerase subunit RPC12/RpoP